MRDLNKELPIKNYDDFICKLSAKFVNKFAIIDMDKDHIKGNQYNNLYNEIMSEVRRIISSIKFMPEYARFLNRSAARYWHESKHFYIYAIFKPCDKEDTKCMTFKVYTK